jgi:hypothetical protein
MKQPRDDHQWVHWLDGAESAPAVAVERREYVADLFAKFGPDVKIVGG